jgi:predicted small secreted protein
LENSHKEIRAIKIKKKFRENISMKRKIFISILFCFCLVFSVKTYSQEKTDQPPTQLADWQMSYEKFESSLLSFSGQQAYMNAGLFFDMGRVVPAFLEVMKIYGKEVIWEGTFEKIEHCDSYVYNAPQSCMIRLKGASPFVWINPLALNKWKQITSGSQVKFRGKLVGAVMLVMGKQIPIATIYNAEPLDKNTSSMFDPSSEVISKKNNLAYDFLSSAEKGDTVKLKSLLKEGADVNTSVDGVTALMLASIGGHTETVKVLLENSANVNLKTKKGATALMMAVRGGYIEIIKNLLEKGAEVSVTDDSGKTALYYAELFKVFDGSRSVIELLSKPPTKNN